MVFSKNGRRKELIRTVLLWGISIGILLLIGCVAKNEYDPTQYTLPAVAIPWMLVCMFIYYMFEPTHGRRRYR